MNLLSWLRKLGIVRWGCAKATYRNAVERPAEIQMDDVFKAGKDLVGHNGAGKKPSRDTGRPV